MARLILNAKNTIDCIVTSYTLSTNRDADSWRLSHQFFTYMACGSLMLSSDVWGGEGMILSVGVQSGKKRKLCCHLTLLRVHRDDAGVNVNVLILFSESS